MYIIQQMLSESLISTSPNITIVGKPGTVLESTVEKSSDAVTTQSPSSVGDAAHLNQLENTKNKSITSKSESPPPSYIDANGDTIPELYYGLPFFTRRPTLIDRDELLPKFREGDDDEYLFLIAHGKINRQLKSGKLISDSTDSTGRTKIREPDEQRQINHYLRIVELSTPHEHFSPKTIKSLVKIIHDELTSDNKNKLFLNTSDGKQERHLFFEKLKHFLNSPNPTTDSVHLVDLTHDRLFTGHVDITTARKDVPITFNLFSNQDYMGILKALRPSILDQAPPITDNEKDALETFKLYGDAQWLGKKDGNFNGISLFDNIFSLAQHMQKRLNIIIFSCSVLSIMPEDTIDPAKQPYFFKWHVALSNQHVETIYAEPIKILKTGCDFINRLSSLLHIIIRKSAFYNNFKKKLIESNNQQYIAKLYIGASNLINILTDGRLSIITNSYTRLYFANHLLYLQHRGSRKSIFRATVNITDYELLLYATQIFLSRELSNHIIGIIENVINIITTKITECSEFIIQTKASIIWTEPLSRLELGPDIYPSVGAAIEHLFVLLNDLKSTYLEQIFRLLNFTKHRIDVVQHSLNNSKSASSIADTVAYKAVTLANQRRVVFENLVKTHCSRHYKYKSRTPTGRDINSISTRSTRSHRTASMRRKIIGVLPKIYDPLYRNSDTITRNNKVKEALTLLEMPLDDKVIRKFGADTKTRKMSQGRVERNDPTGLYIRNRLYSFKNALLKENIDEKSSSNKNSTRKKYINTHSV